MEATDDFQDAVDEPVYEEQPDGSIKYVDKEGYNVRISKNWTFDNAFTFEDEALKEIIMNVHPGNCALTQEMLNTKPAGKIYIFILNSFIFFRTNHSIWQSKTIPYTFLSSRGARALGLTPRRSGILKRIQRILRKARCPCSRL